MASRSRAKLGGCVPCAGNKGCAASGPRKKKKDKEERAPPPATVPLIQVTEFAKVETGKTLTLNQRPKPPRTLREERRVRTLPVHFKYTERVRAPASMQEICPCGPGSSAMAAVKRLLEITGTCEKERESNLIAEMVYERFAPKVLPEPNLRPLLPPDYDSPVVTPLEVKTDIPEYNPIETDDSQPEEEVKEEEEVAGEEATKKPKRSLAERIARAARRFTRRLGRGR